MPRKDFEASETGNWNSAADYSKVKIFRWLAEADEMEMLATYGTSSFEEDFMFNEETKVKARLLAIEKLRKVLSMIIKNTSFAIKAGDKESFEDYEKRLNIMKDGLLNVKKVTTMRNKKIVKIDEKLFDKFLNILIEIKSNLNEPLNKADLIFTHREDFDPKKFKKEMLEHLTDEG
jgi:hypothetical protein